MTEHFRGVVWPRGNKEHGVFRYAIVGILVTDKPLDNIDPKNEVVLDGMAAGMADAIQTIQQKEPAITLGDATMVLTSLDIICE